jgi:23S rRNA pseudouridine1911/1915/1917 synthase
MGLIQNATRNKIQNAATEGNINDVIVKSNYKVKAFDVVRVMLTHPPTKIIAENIPLNIVYEDDALLC